MDVVRQEKPGRRGRRKRLKLRTATRGESPPDDDEGRHVGSESCVIVETLRATVITKRRQRVCGSRDGVPRLWNLWESRRRRPLKTTCVRYCATGTAERRGLRRTAHRDLRARHVHTGCPGTWDGVSVLCREIGTIRRGKPEPVGHREVGARRSSDDAGELTPEDPVERRSASENKLVGGRR